MTLLTVIRHGQGSFNGAEYDVLSKIGQRQAGALGDYFAATQRRFDAIYCGALERQRATAEIVRARLAALGEPPARQTRPAFNEYDSRAVVFTQLPGMIAADPTFADSAAAFKTDRRAFRRVLETALARWASGAHDVDGVETWRAFTARVRDGLAHIIAETAPTARVAIFTSSGVLVAALQQALDLSDEATIGLIWRIRNASCSVFGDEDGRLRLISFNATAHLELKNDPALLTYL